MTIRKLMLPQDLEELIDMLPLSFQYPENPEWSVQEEERDGLENSIRALQKNWWLVRIGQILIPSMRDIITGFVWEEDGKIAGCAILQPRGQSRQWVIGTIATHPEFRRRGIARQLFAACVEFLKKKQASVAILSVIEGNTPAYTLYQKMGLETYSGHYDIEFKPEIVFPMPHIPARFQLITSNINDWQPRFEFSKRITPEKLQKFEPVEPKRFQQPFLLRLLIPLLNKAENLKEEFLLIQDLENDKMAGYLRLGMRQGGKGRHNFLLALDPDCYAFAEVFLQYALHRLSTANPNLVIESAVPQWQNQVYEAAKKLGFTTRLTYHRMGIILE